jgi:predicted ATPase/DNA-binding winged helix-turn-helix (wHTH) protein
MQPISVAMKDDAMIDPEAQPKDVISFGPFRLVVSKRLLTNEGGAVELGARTLDTLIALVSRPNEVVNKRDLLAQVWPDVIVEEGSLRFHVAQLRKVLGDGKDGARYITTQAGRGYCFVAPILRSSDRDNAHAAQAPSFPHANLPRRLTRMVGRDDDALALSTQLTSDRFVTIVGAGGVGKTTVAVAVAHDLMEAFAEGVLFVDLGVMRDPNLVPASIASMLGLSVQSDDATPGLIAYLRDRRLLLILDTCEHLIEAAATLAARIFLAAPQVHILATSREALRVEGEHIYRLATLACPPDDPGLTAAIVQTFPATQLFLERAAASGARLDLSEADAAIVARICRKLDGVTLAIELAATRVAAYGLHQTAELLDQRLNLLWVGQRTAPPRQKTLQATLDWSYGLLSEGERAVLRRLAVFVGNFTIDAALAVVTSSTIDQELVFGALDSLVAKSMVATRPLGTTMRYRLLDTTRAYALEIAADAAELTELATRHAHYYRRRLSRIAPETPALSDAAERMPLLAGLNNVRAALEWCFDTGGNAEIGVELAAAAAPVFSALCLLTECHRWSERAILALKDEARGSCEEMHLQAAMGLSLMFTRGNNEAARAALNRSLAIAEERGDALNQLRLLGLLRSFHERIGDFKAALCYARQSSAVSVTIENPAAVALAHCFLGSSLHHVGDLGGARAELEAARQHGPSSLWTGMICLGFHPDVYASAVLAKTLWLQGKPAQALERARQTVKDAAGMDHPVTLCLALSWAVSVFLWTGNLKSAEEHIDWIISHAESHSLDPYVAVGHSLRWDLTIRSGDAKGGVENMQECLEALHAARYELLTTAFNISLVQGLCAIGQFAEGAALIDETIRLVEANGDLCYLPELLRVKGALLLSTPEPSAEDAENCLMRSLEESRRQGARAWELRTAVDLAALWADQGKPQQSRALLRPVYEQFTEGLDTADLKMAKSLLATLD